MLEGIEKFSAFSQKSSQAFKSKIFILKNSKTCDYSNSVHTCMGKVQEWLLYEIKNFEVFPFDLGTF